MYKIALAVVALAATVAGFDPVTLTLGTTSFVLSAPQVAVAVGSLGALALAKEAIIFNELTRTRGRRSAEVNQVNLEPLLEAIATIDGANCGKAIVCYSVAKPEADRTADEARLVSLFDGFEGKIDPTHKDAQYHLALLTGSYNSVELCERQFATCPFKAHQLSEWLKQ